MRRRAVRLLMLHGFMALAIVTQSSASTSQSPLNLPVALSDLSMHFCASRRQGDIEPVG